MIEAVVPDTLDGDFFEQCARLAGDLLDAPIAMISIASHASGVPIAAGRLADVPAAVAARLAKKGASVEGVGLIPVGVEDAPIRAGAATALYGRDGTRLGTLAVFSAEARIFTSLALRRLTDVGRLVADHVLLRAKAGEIQQRLAALNEASPSAIIFARGDGTADSWNAATSTLLGWPPAATHTETLIGEEEAPAPRDRVEEAPAPRDRGEHVQYLGGSELNAGDTYHDVETTQVTRAGSVIDVSISAAPVHATDGDVVGTVVVMNDLTGQKKLGAAERKRSKVLELEANDAPLAEIYERLVDSVEFSIEGGICTILRCKGNALEHVASGPALPPIWVEAIGQARIGPMEGSCGTAAYFGKTIVVDDIATDIRWQIPRPLALQLGLRACWSAPIFNPQGIVEGTLAVYSKRPRVPTEDQLRIMHDAARLASIAIEGQRTRGRLEDLALRDSLTGLPNRAVFEDRLRRAIEAAKPTRERVFIGLLDLDRFKLINDSLGHVVGDQLLVEVANRLRQATRPQDTVARMGGDEFLFLLSGVENRDGAEAIARRILGAFDASFSPAGNELFVHASLGFSVYPDDAMDPTQLLRFADHVMYDVKARQTRVGFYERKSSDTTQAKLPLETSLYRALEKREFVLRYEPRIGRGNLLHAAEAHVYWNHPQRGFLSDDHFMGVADEAGLSASIGSWAIAEACGFASRWKAAGGAGRVAVNVSARQCCSRDFVSTVVSAIEAAGVVPAQLSIEIRETLVGSSFDGVAAALTELRSYGVHTAIGHFGTGSLSLPHLRRLPVDALKIDRSFFIDTGDATGESGDNRAILEVLVALGRALHLAVAAEGIETEPQFALAVTSGCYSVQGALFAPALPEETFLRWSPPSDPASPVLAHWPASNPEGDAMGRLGLELDRRTKEAPEAPAPA